MLRRDFTYGVVVQSGTGVTLGEGAGHAGRRFPLSWRWLVILDLFREVLKQPPLNSRCQRH